MLLLDEPVNATRLALLALIIVGVVGLQLTSGNVH
jgi:multidrug transporter EmrE-like cation transporter